MRRRARHATSIAAPSTRSASTSRSTSTSDTASRRAIAWRPRVDQLRVVEREHGLGRLLEHRALDLGLQRVHVGQHASRGQAGHAQHHAVGEATAHRAHGRRPDERARQAPERAADRDQLSRRVGQLLQHGQAVRDHAHRQLPVADQPREEVGGRRRVEEDRLPSSAGDALNDAVTAAGEGGGSSAVDTSELGLSGSARRTQLAFDVNAFDQRIGAFDHVRATELARRRGYARKVSSHATQRAYPPRSRCSFAARRATAFLISRSSPAPASGPRCRKRGSGSHDDVGPATSDLRTRRNIGAATWASASCWR